MTTISRAGILGLGISVPERRLTNKDLETIVDTTSDWIVSRTGIEERRVVSKGENASDFSAVACRNAIEDAGLKPEDIDMLINCTYTGDMACPSTGCIVHGKLGLKDAPAFDLNGACSGWIYGLQLADTLVKSGMYKHILVVGVDVQTHYVNYEDRGTCILFGDGAGAVVVGPSPDGNRGILSTHLGADSKGTDLIRIEGSGTSEVAEGWHTPGKIWMNGREVFKFAVRTVGIALDTVLEKAGLKSSDVDLLVPHQANIRIIDSAAERLSLPRENVIVNIQKYGNTASASIPLAMHTAREEGRLTPGTTIALVGFGAGFTFGAALVRW